ncbi:MAG: hypothetical protein ACI94Y_001416 [Maribacter sp.]|jgi:hypothetical protein
MDAGLQYLRVFMDDFPKGYYFLEIRAERYLYQFFFEALGIFERFDVVIVAIHV